MVKSSVSRQGAGLERRMPGWTEERNGGARYASSQHRFKCPELVVAQSLASASISARDSGDQTKAQSRMLF